MSSEHPDRQTPDPADEPAQALSIPRWAVIVATLVVLVPVLVMASMMLTMGLLGPPMHGGMAAPGPGRFTIVGVIPLLLVIGVIYGVYRLYRAGTE